MTVCSSALTAPSTADRREWWADEAIRASTDWESLVRQHHEVFHRLCEHVGVSS